MDSQTKHGCIITNNEHHIVGGGYNSFPKGCPDHELPNTRPEKYPYVLHSEANALSFCTIRPVGGIMYVTGEPCLECVKRMWQEGISKVYFLPRKSTMIENYSDYEKKARETLLKYCPVEFIEYSPDFSFMENVIKNIKQLDIKGV